MEILYFALFFHFIFPIILFFFIFSKYFEYFLYLFGLKSKWNPRGKVIVITGASSGIGKELACRYAKYGSKLALCARRENELNQVIQTCKELGASEVIGKVADVSREQDCQDFMKHVGETFGRIDCLILNAGISMGDFFEDIQDLSIFHRLMEVNYFGSVYCTSYALPFIKKAVTSPPTSSSSPRIAVISSGAGQFGIPTRSGYSASKFALHGFFESLYRELYPKYGILVTLICPGVVKTDINRTRLGSTPMQLDLKNAMSVEKAGEMIVDAISKGTRELSMTFLAQIAFYLKPFLPGLLDRAMEGQIKDLKGARKKED